MPVTSETTVPVPALPRVMPCWARTLPMPAMPMSRPAAEVRGKRHFLAALSIALKGVKLDSR